MTLEEVEERLQELIDIPMILYQECLEEGFTEEEAIKETFIRFYE